MKKSMIVGASLLLAGPAFATTIDGVTVPTTPGNHDIAGTIQENTTTTVGETLTGGGTIGFIDNQSVCNGSCTLTYKFGGYKLTDFTAPANGNDGRANFTGGFVNFIATDAGGNQNNFLTTTADTLPGSQFTLQGTLVNMGTQNLGAGLLSVTGGDAQGVFDNDSYPNGSGGLSDLKFNISASPQDGALFTGSADAHYVSPSPSNAVPEPSELAILGLGLLLVGVGVGYRRRNIG